MSGEELSKLEPELLAQAKAVLADLKFKHATGLESPNRIDLPKLTELATRDIPEKVPLYLDLLFPGAYLLVGRPKVGKSWFLMQLAIAAAESRDFLGFKCITSGHVLLILAEDDDARVKSRLNHMGVATFPDNVHFITQQGFIALARQYAPHITFEQFLRQYLLGHPEIKYTFLDTETTIRQIWKGESGKGERDLTRVTESDYQQTRAFDEIALETRSFIALTNHAKKRGGEEFDIHESINRSNTAFAGCSGSLVLADFPDRQQLEGNSRQRVLGIRGRDLRDDLALALVQREADACFQCLGIYEEVRQNDAEDEILKAVERIQEETGGASYVALSDIADDLGMKTFAVQRRLSRMFAKSHTRHWGKYIVATKRGRHGGIRLDPR